MDTCGVCVCDVDENSYLPRCQALCPVLHKYFVFVFWLCRVFVAVHGLSLVVASGSCYSWLQLQGLLIAVASLVTEHGLQACGLSSYNTLA